MNRSLRLVGVLVALAALAQACGSRGEDYLDLCLPDTACYLAERPRIESYTEYPEEEFALAKVGFTLTNVGGDDHPVECTIFVEDAEGRPIDAEVLDAGFRGAKVVSHLVGLPLGTGRPHRARIECENPAFIE
jgi:hypothetical protein